MFVSQSGEISRLAIHHKLIRRSDDMIKLYLPKGNVTRPVNYTLNEIAQYHFLFKVVSYGVDLIEDSMQCSTV